MEYTIAEILSILGKRIWIIILCIVLFTAGAYTVSKYVIEKEYTASVSMYVAPKRDNADIFATLSDLNYAQQVVNTYIVILKTNHFLDQVLKESKLNYSRDELKDMVKMNAVDDTEIFEIHVTTKNPQDSLLLANTFAELAPKKIIEIKNADSVKAVDPAILPTKPSFPILLINTIIGFALGLAAGIMLAFILETVDKRIKEEEDILKHYKVPILGMVPFIENK